MARDDDAATVAGVQLTHPDRVLFPGQGITKRELADYYGAVAERMLPHVRGRPLTLVRCPAGQETECFYQRRAVKGTPRALGRVTVPVEGEDETYLVADTLAALVSLVQIGVLEVHVWGARRDRLDRPDRMILDLDPAPGVEWARVVEGAREVRERLAAAGLESWVKTTGGKGLHVVAPLQRRAGWDDVRELSLEVAEAMVGDAPRPLPDQRLQGGARGEDLRGLRAQLVERQRGGPVLDPLAGGRAGVLSARLGRAGRRHHAGRTSRCGRCRSWCGPGRTRGRGWRSRGRR